MDTGQRIRKIRNSLGLSQVKFAEGLCLSAGYIALLESKRRRINERIIRLICITYGVSETWLKTGKGMMYDTETEARAEYIVRIFKELNVDFQNYAISVISDLIGLQKSS